MGRKPWASVSVVRKRNWSRVGERVTQSKGVWEHEEEKVFKGPSK